MTDLDLVPFTTGRLLWAVADGSDPDNEPDLIPCDGGTIKLTPIVPNAKTVHATEPGLVAFGPISLTLDPAGSGYGLWNGSNQILLDDMGDGSTNPTVAAGAYTHRVDFLNITAQGTTVKFPTMNVRISADTATDPAHPDIPMLPSSGGVCNLAQLSPITATGVTPITQGRPGLGIVSIAVDTSNLVTTMTDNSTLTAPVQAAFSTGLSTAVSNAQSSASAAATSETNAANSATSASNSASAAATSATNAQAAASTATDAFTAHMRGPWSATTAYAIDDLATDQGSTWRRIVAGTTAGTPSADATNWTVFAQRGTDGTGSVSSVAGVAPDAGGNVTLTPAEIGAKPSTYVPAWSEITGKPTIPATAADVGALPSSGVVPDANLPTRLTDASLAAAYVQASKVGAANGVAPLDSGSKVPAANLPSYVDDVLDYANLAAFPTTGEAGKIYVADDTNKTYRWNTGSSAYIEVSPGPGSTDSVAEGSVNKYYTDARAVAAVQAATALALTGAPTAPTPTTSDNSTKIATTAFVKAQSSGSSAPLARTIYAPSTAVAPTAAATTSDIDATNLAITFTTTSTGRTRMVLEGALNPSAANLYWSLRNGTTNIAGSEVIVAAGSNVIRRTRVEIFLTLTANTSYTLKWAGRGATAVGSILLAGGSSGEFSAASSYGPAIMEAWGE